MRRMYNLSQNLKTGKCTVTEGESEHYPIDCSLIDVVDEDGTSVLVRVGNEDLKIWVDTSLEEDGVRAYWNDIVLFTDNLDHMLIKGIQESPLAELIFDAAIYYAEEYIFESEHI